MKTSERKIDLYEVAEITLSYRAKASLLPRVASSRQCMRYLHKSGIRTGLGLSRISR
ncbi:hypothetical protein [Algoriphagus resistens]|uniref:hypothetical protein n=1 Tax=Algoriphagus resistens TaxID=1750590 RepID=UPI000B0F6665|nr:hypothetical protein [Algoriphagus resistens]